MGEVTNWGRPGAGRWAGESFKRWVHTGRLKGGSKGCHKEFHIEQVGGWAQVQVGNSVGMHTGEQTEVRDP